MLLWEVNETEQRSLRLRSIDRRRAFAMDAAMAQLPYPDRFYSAAAFAGFSSSSTPSSPASASGRILSAKRLSDDLPDETRLILFALYKQATVGPCTLKKPWGWNLVETAKWTSWTHLGNMNSLEAMRLFVRTVEEIDPSWWVRSHPQGVEVLEDRAAVQSASKELTKLLLAKDVPTVPRAVDPNTNGKHLTDEGLTFAEDKLDLKDSETPKMAEMHRPVAEGIEAITSYHEWVRVTVTGRKPLARYQHAAAVVEGKLYVVGGNFNGRYLNDVQVLDLKKLTWSKVDSKVPQSPLYSPLSSPLQPWFPHCAGHRLIRWGRQLLAVTGHLKDGLETVNVHAFDTHSLSWTKLEVYGQAPGSRGGQSVTLIGSQLYMFGGEDSKRRVLNDLNILDLETMTWEAVTASGVCPSPRSDHVASAYCEKYIFIFGGGFHSDCYNDLHVLDLENMEWSPVQTQGVVPRPRAGHAGANHGDRWYIIGGGDNTGAMSETLVLDMATLSWSTEAVIQGATAIASEGLSVVVSGDTLLAFGGYNGAFSNEVHAYKLESAQLPHVAKVKPVGDTVVETQAPNGGDAPSGSQENFDPGVEGEESESTTPEEMKSVLELDSPPTSATSRRESSLNEEIEHLRMSAGAAQGEVEKLKVENAAALSSLADVEQELLSVRSQLQGEQSRSFRLEVEVAELRQKLSSMDALQKELDLLQRQKVASEKAASEAAQKETTGTGVWGWLAGAPPAPRYDS